MNQIKRSMIPFLLGCLLIAAASAATAQAPAPADVPPTAASFDLLNDLAIPVFLAVVWTVLGIILFAVSIKIMVTLSPFPVQKEIEEDQNTALGIIMGALIIGISIILAAAILG